MRSYINLLVALSVAHLVAAKTSPTSKVTFMTKPHCYGPVTSAATVDSLFTIKVKESHVKAKRITALNIKGACVDKDVFAFAEPAASLVLSPFNMMNFKDDKSRPLALAHAQDFMPHSPGGHSNGCNTKQYCVTNGFQSAHVPPKGPGYESTFSPFISGAYIFVTASSQVLSTAHGTKASTTVGQYNDDPTKYSTVSRHTGPTGHIKPTGSATHT